MSYGAASLLLAGSGIALVRTSGYDVPEATRQRLSVLSPWQFVVVEHAARRIACPDHPSAPSPDDVAVAGYVDSALADMSAVVQRDFGRLLAYLEHLSPLPLGLGSRFTRLSPAAQDRVLTSMEESREDLIRGGFGGLKSLVMMGYYRDPRTWAMLGYDGPLIGRPEQGWSK